MPRLRQRYPSSYLTNAAINGEFEQLIRYLNSAELGDKTLAELMQVLFNDDGELAGPIVMRLDPDKGLQYRLGEYPTDEEGWQTLAQLDEIRGQSGTNIGEVTPPVLHARYDHVATGGEQTLDFAHNSDEEVLAYKDGILLQEGALADYTLDPNGGSGSSGSITLTNPLTVGQVLTLFKVREDVRSLFQRQDLTLLAAQAVFPLIHDDPANITVYKNGVLLRMGGDADYVTDPHTNTVVLATTALAGDVVTFIHFDTSLNQTLAGLMLEQDYVDPASGFIHYSKIQIADDQIPQTKVANLTADLATKMRVYVSASEPNAPESPSLWYYTAPAIPQLLYWDGIAWVQINPESLLPSYTTTNIGMFLRVSPTGSGNLEWTALDLTGLIPRTYMGATNGVAALDSNARIIPNQMPEVQSRQSYYYNSEGGATNGDYTLTRFYKVKAQIVAVAIRTTSGTCSITPTVGGVKKGSTFTASSTPNEFPLGTPITIDASSGSQSLGFKLENAAAPNNLEVTLVVEILND